VGSSTLPLVLALALIVLVALTVLARPLLLASTSPELAAARGVPVGPVGFAYLLALSLSVALCAITIGSILSTALLVGPAAAALRIARRPGRAMAAAAALGVAATWLGVLLAYDSYEWPPHHRGWPVSFFVVALVFAEYLLCGLAGGRRRAAAPGLDVAPPAELGG
jgi:zinc/manganese transport system permease protein